MFSSGRSDEEGVCWAIEAVVLEDFGADHPILVGYTDIGGAKIWSEQHLLNSPCKYTAAKRQSIMIDTPSGHLRQLSLAVEWHGYSNLTTHLSITLTETVAEESGTLSGGAGFGGTRYSCNGMAICRTIARDATQVLLRCKEHSVCSDSDRNSSNEITHDVLQG